MKRKAPAEDRLISGKLRRKSARSAHETVAVDGVDYAWSYRHGWVVWGKGLRAVSLSVALHPGRTRELILDLAVKLDLESAPPEERRLRAALVDGIRAAREAGWDPESRGRAFRYEMEGGI